VIHSIAVSTPSPMKTKKISSEVYTVLQQILQVGPPGQGPGSKASKFGENRDTQFWKKSPVTCAHFYTYCKQCFVRFNIDKNAAVLFAVCPSLP